MDIIFKHLIFFIDISDLFDDNFYKLNEDFSVFLKEMQKEKIFKKKKIFKK